MDGSRFDILTRSFAATKTRRGLLGGFVALGAGLLGSRAADAQVSQVSCGNRFCASNPGGCNPGCVCCVYTNPVTGTVTNSRCRPPGTCSPGTAVCPPGQVPGPSGCAAPTTTQPPCVPESDAAACARQGLTCGPTTNNCGQAVASCGACAGGQTCCGGACSDCPCGQVELSNGSCATPCAGFTCAGCFACAGDVDGSRYCQSPGFFNDCDSTDDCAPGQFCTWIFDACVPLCQPA